MQKIVNNIALLRPYIEEVFKQCGDEYSLIQIQIMQRRKDLDNTDLKKGTRIIKSYLIGSVGHFDKIVDEIIDMCDYFHARAYINVNPKNADNVRWNLIANLQDQLKKHANHGLQGIVDSSVGQMGAAHGLTTWIIDIDDPVYEEEAIQKARDIYNEERNKKGDQTDVLVMKVPTVNGVHAIIRPFKISRYQTGYICNEDGTRVDLYEIKKNASTILYANVNV